MLDKGHIPERMRVSFILNGNAQAIDVRPFDRLTRVLRDQLGLTATKVGCDAGDCGACTVSLDGDQVCACLVAAGQIDGADIVTAEGPELDLTLERLRQKFLEHGAAQCGICTPAMLMAARDLLANNPAPQRSEINDALGGVLCRCTGYTKIVEAVIAAATVSAQPVAEPPATGSAVGARLARADGAAKVAGSEQFGADAAPADALWLRAIRAPHARARFRLGDVQALRKKFPGLAAIFSAPDLPGPNNFGIYPHLKDQPVLADGQIRYRGEAFLALVGERDAVEAVGLDDIPVEFFPQTPITDLDEALSANAIVHTEHPDNVLTAGLVERGDVETGFTSAAVTVAAEVTTAFVEHAYIEPEAGYARRLDGDRIEIVACTQSPYMDRDEIARVLGLANEQVRVVPSACGGGFGGKLDMSIQPLLAVAAWQLNRPVRAVYSRIESIASSTKRHPARIRGRMGVDTDGRITAFASSADFNTGAYASWGPTVADRVPAHATGPYRVASVRNRSRAIYTNQVPAGAFRGFGVPQAAVVHETLLDDVAQRLAIDRLDLRHLNALRAGDVTASGQRLQTSCGLAACLDAVRNDWQAMLARAAQHNRTPGNTRRGVGIGCMWYGCGNTSMSNPSTIRVTLDASGTLTLYNGAADIGQGSTTVILQICADALGLPTAAFTLVIGDTDLTPDAGKSSASRQTFVSGQAAYLAGRALRADILAAADATADAVLRLDGDRLIVTDDGVERAIDLQQRLQDGVLEGVGRFDPPTEPLDDKGQGIPYATYGFGAQICELDVDVELGTTTLHRIVAAHDVGRVINPTLTEGQIHGGIAQGIGMALMEEFLPGVTENLHDYLIPTIGDIPEIDIKLIEDPEPLGPYGAKGVGEPALIPTPAAILGAIRHATGVTVAELPATPHRVLAALTDHARQQH